MSRKRWGVSDHLGNYIGTVNLGKKFERHHTTIASFLRDNRDIVTLKDFVSKYSGRRGQVGKNKKVIYIDGKTLTELVVILGCSKSTIALLHKKHKINTIKQLKKYLSLSRDARAKMLGKERHRDPIVFKPLPEMPDDRTEHCRRGRARVECVHYPACTDNWAFRDPSPHYTPGTDCYVAPGDGHRDIDLSFIIDEER